MSITQTASSEDLDGIWKKIRSIKFAMLTSEDGQVLRSRPMAASQDNFSGTLWFFTRASSHKVTEVGRDEHVNVSYADPGSQTYVSLSGVAAIDRTRASIDTHWSKAVEPWFPQGKADPDIALLRIDVQLAEYWDGPSSKMVRAWEYAKSAMTGKTPDMGENRKLAI